jgi:hypothetical protein
MRMGSRDCDLRSFVPRANWCDVPVMKPYHASDRFTKITFWLTWLNLTEVRPSTVLIRGSLASDLVH